MENVRNHRDIKVITSKARMNCLVSESNYHKTKNSLDNLLAIETKKKQTPMKEPFYLDLLILKRSKIVMHDFRLDYVKLKYGEKLKICYMETRPLLKKTIKM